MNKIFRCVPKRLCTRIPLTEYVDRKVDRVDEKSSDKLISKTRLERSELVELKQEGRERTWTINHRHPAKQTSPLFHPQEESWERNLIPSHLSLPKPIRGVVVSR